VYAGTAQGIARFTGGQGRRLRDGCPYLLAYYMGLHHGFIEE